MNVGNTEQDETETTRPKETSEECEHRTTLHGRMQGASEPRNNKTEKENTQEDHEK